MMQLAAQQVVAARGVRAMPVPARPSARRAGAVTCRAEKEHEGRGELKLNSTAVPRECGCCAAPLCVCVGGGLPTARCIVMVIRRLPHYATSSS